MLVFYWAVAFCFFLSFKYLFFHCFIAIYYNHRLITIDYNSRFKTIASLTKQTAFHYHDLLIINTSLNEVYKSCQMGTDKFKKLSKKDYLNNKQIKTNAKRIMCLYLKAKCCWGIIAFSDFCVIFQLWYFLNTILSIGMCNDDYKT